MEGCTDGTIHGQKYFDCQDGRGLYFPLASLRPDERFTDPGTYCRFDTSGNTPGTAHCKKICAIVIVQRESHIHSLSSGVLIMGHLLS